MKIFLVSFLLFAITASPSFGLFLKKKLLLKSLLSGGLDHFGGNFGGGYPSYPPAGYYPPGPAYPPPPAYGPPPPAYGPPPYSHSPPVLSTAIGYLPPPASPPAVSYNVPAANYGPPAINYAPPAVNYAPPSTGLQGGLIYSVSSVPVQAPAVTYAVASPVAAPPPAPTGVSYGVGGQQAYGILLDSNYPSSGYGGYTIQTVPHLSKC